MSTSNPAYVAPEPGQERPWVPGPNSWVRYAGQHVAKIDDGPVIVLGHTTPARALVAVYQWHRREYGWHRKDVPSTFASTLRATWASFSEHNPECWAETASEDDLQHDCDCKPDEPGCRDCKIDLLREDIHIDSGCEEYGWWVEWYDNVTDGARANLVPVMVWDAR